MINKKKIFLTTFALGLATVALASCGKKDKVTNDDKKDDNSDVDPTTTYTIKLDVNDPVAKFAEGTTTTYSVTSASDLITKIGSVEPTKTGYKFTGWYIDTEVKTALVATTDLSKLTKESDGSIYIYAAYAIQTYTVTFNLKGNAAVEAESSISTTANVEYNKKATIIPSVFTTAAKDSLGHEMTFTGWYTDEACTAENKVDPTTVEIKENTTFYAGWTIVEITSVAEFMAYINQTKVETNAYLSADLTFDETKSAEVIDRTKDTCVEAGLSNGTNLTNEFAAKFYGDCHTLAGLTIKGTDLTNVALFGKFSGTMQDVTFESPTITTNKKTSGFIAGEITGDAVFSDITFDGAEVTSTGADGYASIVAGQIKGNDITATFEGLTIKNSNMEVTKYSGGVVSGINKSSNVTLNFTDCLIDIDINSTDSSNGSIGLIFGQQDAEKSNNCKFNFDGVIATGSIDSVKNTAAFIGDLKNANKAKCDVTIKNSAVIGFKNSATNGSSSTTNTFIGQNSSTTAVFENVYYQEYGTNILVKGDYGWDVVEQGQSTSLEELKEIKLSNNFTFDYTASSNVDLPGTFKVTLNNNTLEVLDTKVIDLANATCDVKTVETGQSFISESETNTYKFNGPICYYEKAVAGKAGYGVKVQFALPKYPNGNSIIIFKGVSVKGLTSYNVDPKTGVVTGYIILDNETKDSVSGKTELETALETTALVSKEIKIVWGNDDNFNVSGNESTPTYINVFAKPVTYTFDFQNTEDHQLITKKSETPHAKIALEDAEGYSTGLTAAVDSADDTKLNITAGEIAYHTTYKGNTVFVKFSVPSGITTTATSEQEFNNCKKVTGDKTSFILAVNVAKGNTKFSFTWDKAKYDMDEYTINVADTVTLVANSDASTSTSLTSTLYTLANLEDKTLAVGASEKWGKDLTIVASASDADKVFIENAGASTETYTDLTGTQQTAAKRLKVASAKANGVYVKIDLSAYKGSVDIKVSYCTGSNDSARHLILWKEGNFENPTITADNSTCKTPSEATLTVDAGSIYYLGSASGNMYIYAISLIAK